MNFIVSEDDIEIEDSFGIFFSFEMEEVIRQLKEQYPENLKVKSIKINRLIRKWESYNLLYNLNLFKEKTKNVNLGNITLLNSCGYYLLSLIYEMFV